MSMVRCPHKEPIGYPCVPCEADRLRDENTALKEKCEREHHTIQELVSQNEAAEAKIAAMSNVVEAAKRLPAYQEAESGDWFCSGSINDLWDALSRLDGVGK